MCSKVCVGPAGWESEGCRGPVAPEHLPEDKALALLHGGHAKAAAVLLHALREAESQNAYLHLRVPPAANSMLDPMCGLGVTSTGPHLSSGQMFNHMFAVE